MLVYVFICTNLLRVYLCAHMHLCADIQTHICIHVLMIVSMPAWCAPEAGDIHCRGAARASGVLGWFVAGGSCMQGVVDHRPPKLHHNLAVHSLMRPSNHVCHSMSALFLRRAQSESRALTKNYMLPSSCTVAGRQIVGFSRVGTD